MASTSFYPRWVAANGVAELFGLGGTLALGGALVRAAPSVDQSAALILVTALLAVIAGTLLEGVLLGACQTWALRAALPRLEAVAWIRATALGAGLAWTVGMVPSTVIGLLTLGTPAAPAAPPAEPSAGIEFLLAAGLGAILGPFLGMPQGSVLRRHGGQRGRWVVANVAAWAVGMPIVFATMSTLPPDPSAPRLIATIATGTLATGLVVGAIHGRVLQGMLARMSTQPAHAS